MKKTGLIVLMAILAVSLTANENDLWGKAKQFVKNGENLVSGKITNTSIQLDKNDQETMRSVITIEIQQEDEGISTSFVSGSRNGEEVAADDREAEQYLQQDYTPKEGSFFDDVVSFEQTSEEKVIDDKECIKFDYTAERTRQEKKKEIEEIETGSIWLEKSTGKPVFREFVSDPLPKQIKEMNIQITYTSFEDAVTASKVETELLVSVLLMKMRMNTIMEFSEFWRYTTE
jgi:hypothetical protein